MGSSDRPSQDAEWDRGEEYDGTEGGGEELESSHRPDVGYRREIKKESAQTGSKHTGVVLLQNAHHILCLSFNLK